MTIDSVDVSSLIRAYLITSGTDFYTLVGTRVFQPELPENVEGMTATFDNSVAGFMFKEVGSGDSHRNIDLDFCIFDGFCFGGLTNNVHRWNECTELFRAFKDIIHVSQMKKVTGKGVILHSELVSRPNYIRYPESNWPAVHVSFRADIRPII